MEDITIVPTVIRGDEPQEEVSRQSLTTGQVVTKKKEMRREEHSSRESLALDMPKSARDIGLSFYQTSKTAFPPDKPTGRNVKKWVEEKKIIWQYTW